MLGLKIRYLWIALLLVVFMIQAPALTPVGAEEGAKKTADLDHPFDPTVKPYMDKGKYARAIEYLYNDAEEEAYKGILNLKPKDARGWYTLCHIHNLMGEHDKAIEMVEMARKNGVDNPRIKLVHGEALYAKGEIAKARKIFGPLYKANPGMHKAIYNMAVLHYEAGELAKAAGLYKGLAEIDLKNYSKNAESIYCKAQGFIYFKDYASAVNMFASACYLDPGMQEAWYARASMYLDMYNSPKAFKITRELLDINWRSSLGNLLQAKCVNTSYYQKDRMGNTEMELKTALKYGPKNQEILAYAIFFYAFWEHYDEAQAYVKKALAINPNSIAILSQVGFYYYISGQEEKFKALEAKVKKLNPHCAEFYYAIGGVMDKKYGYRFAIEYCRKALEANPNFTKLYPTLGRNLMFTGAEEEGEEFLRASLADTGGFDPVVKNILMVVDAVKEGFVERKSEHFLIKMEKDDNRTCGPYVEYLLEDAWEELSEKYKYTPKTLNGKIIVLVFNDPNQFAVRTIGVPGLGQAMGVSFGTALNFKSAKAMYSRRAHRHIMPWAQVAYHEFTHVITLQQSESRTSRWFTEALSEMEQRLKSHAWGREESRIGDARFVRKLRAGNLISCVDLDHAFVSRDVMDAYYQSRLMGDWMRETWGYDKLIEINKQYAKRCTTAEMVKACFDMTVAQYDKAFADWSAKKYEKFQVGPAYIPENIAELKDKMEKKENYYNAQLRADYAMACLQNGKHEDVMKYVAMAEKLDPKNADVFLIKGLIAAMNKDKNGAIKFLKKADALGAKDKLTIYGTMAKIYAPPRGAAPTKVYIDYLKKAYDVFPSDANLVLQLATIYEQSGDIAAARKMQEEYLKLNDTNINYRKKMIEIYAKDGKPERVAQMYREIHWIDPFIKDTHESALAAFLAVKWFAEAAVEYEVLAMGDNNRAPKLVKAAECYIQAGKLAKATSILNEALDADAQNQDAALALKAKIAKMIAEQKNAPKKPATQSKAN